MAKSNRFDMFELAKMELKWCTLKENTYTLEFRLDGTKINGENNT